MRKQCVPGVSPPPPGYEATITHDSRDRVLSYMYYTIPMQLATTTRQSHHADSDRIHTVNVKFKGLWEKAWWPWLPQPLQLLQPWRMKNNIMLPRDSAILIRSDTAFCSVLWYQETYVTVPCPVPVVKGGYPQGVVHRHLRGELRVLIWSVDGKEQLQGK